MIVVGGALLLLVLVLAVTVALVATRRPEHDRHKSGPAAASRRSIGLLAAAAVLVVGVVGLVVVVGLEQPPDLDRLDGDAVRPDAAVAWLDPADGEGSACLWVGRPDGVLTELTCEVEAGEVLAWTDEGIVARSWADPQPQLVVVDPATGEVLERRREDPGDPDDLGGVDEPWPDRGEAYWSLREGDELSLRTDDDRELWRVQAPSGYDVGPATTSPDGAWVATVDAASRLLVLPADGSAPPRVWAEDVPRWLPVVWEEPVAAGR